MDRNFARRAGKEQVMVVLTEGRERLGFLEAICDLAYGPLNRAVQCVLERASPATCRRVGAILIDELRRMEARHSAAFGGRRLPHGKPPALGLLLGRVRRAHRRWMHALRTLRDDGELDVYRRDEHGRQRPTWRLVMEAALADNALSERIMEIYARGQVLGNAIDGAGQ
jgi:hypothetical protein